jgi:hypothetical protein
MNKKHLYITLIGLLAVVLLILVLNKFAVPSGAMVYDREVLDKYYFGCNDTDPLNEYDVKGLVKYKKYQYKDFCGGDKLFQAYCRTSNRATLTRGYPCPNGCENGVCLSEDN